MARPGFYFTEQSDFADYPLVFYWRRPGQGL